MLAPLPDDLLETLKELRDCGGIIDDQNYKPEERANLLKLQAVGLVDLSWRLTQKGTDRLKDS